MIATGGWAESLRDQRHIGDFRNWQDSTAYETALTRLLRDLQDSSEVTSSN